MSAKIMESSSIVLLASLILRWLVSLYPYSGAGLPPMFGDYEAQRHWQEITVNLPVSLWYTNSSTNDLLYWGLDYPPLTAYHSYVNGKIAALVNPAFVALETSRGFESYNHKLFMRYTVFLMDILVYVPAVFFLVSASRNKLLPSTNWKSKLNYLALLYYPGLYLIDYGHFQYNNASLGLFIAAVAAVISEYNCLGSVFFSLALNYKQMELYHALPFFFFLLGKCLNESSVLRSFLKLVGIGLSVVFTFGLIWLPYLDSYSNFVQVLGRVFPFNRGLFEDKVASVWCSLSVLIKFKTLFDHSQMAIICLFCTAACSLPSCLHLLRRSASAETFKYSLLNVSLVFFLLSFHVHEKSILLVTVAACLLYGRDPVVTNWLFVTSLFSMTPLLKKDGLLLPCLALTVIWLLVHKFALAYCESVSHVTPFAGSGSCKHQFDRDALIDNITPAHERLYTVMYDVSLVCMFILTACFMCIDPPQRYPDLFPVLISLVSCAHFVLFAVYFHYRQFTLPPQLQFKKSKKLN